MKSKFKSILNKKSFGKRNSKKHGVMTKRVKSSKRKSLKRKSLTCGMRKYFGLNELENSMKNQVTPNQPPQNQELVSIQNKQQDLQQQEKRAEELIIGANLGGITLLGLAGLTGLAFDTVFKPGDRKKPRDDNKQPTASYKPYQATSSKVKM